MISSLAEKDETKEYFLWTKVMTFHPLLILQHGCYLWVSGLFLSCYLCVTLYFMLNQPLKTVHMPKLCFNLFSLSHPPNPQIIYEKYWIHLQTRLRLHLMQSRTSNFLDVTHSRYSHVLIKPVKWLQMLHVGKKMKIN